MQESEIKGVVAEIAVLGSLGFQVNSQTNEDDSTGVEPFGLVDRGMEDRIGRGVRLGYFPQVAAAQLAARAERAAADGGLFVEDENLLRMAEPCERRYRKPLKWAP